MAEGGGFCELHGPFDPPHLTCPYCAMEQEKRRAYGPPPDASPDPAPAPAQAPAPVEHAAPPSGFVRQTVEPEVKPRLDMTEIVPRRMIDREIREALDENDDPVPDPIGWLVVKEPLARRGEILKIRANQIIGRDGDVRFDDPRLSRQHARLTFEPPADAPDSPAVFHLWPFGTTNPVYVNAREIRGATPLGENDEIRLGDTLFVFKVLAD